MVNASATASRASSGFRTVAMATRHAASAWRRYSSSNASPSPAAAAAVRSPSVPFTSSSGRTTVVTNTDSFGKRVMKTQRGRLSTERPPLRDRMGVGETDAHLGRRGSRRAASLARAAHRDDRSRADPERGQAPLGDLEGVPEGSRGRCRTGSRPGPGTAPCRSTRGSRPPVSNQAIVSGSGVSFMKNGVVGVGREGEQHPVVAGQVPLAHEAPALLQGGLGQEGAAGALRRGADPVGDLAEPADRDPPGGAEVGVGRAVGALDDQAQRPRRSAAGRSSTAGPGGWAGTEPEPAVALVQVCGLLERGRRRRQGVGQAHPLRGMAQ